MAVWRPIVSERQDGRSSDSGRPAHHPQTEAAVPPPGKNRMATVAVVSVR